MALQNGLVLLFVQDGEVVGYNRYATHPDTVYETLCSAFQIDSSTDYSSRDSFVDWAGRIRLKDYRTLRRVQWIDKDQALIAFNAARAGLEDMGTGKLAWAIDAAVHPNSQRSGIAKTLSSSMRHTLRKSDFSHVAYRMFELCKINKVNIGIDNGRSKKVFVDPTSSHFAYTEEDIEIGDDIGITVRWNQWLKRC